MNLKYTTEEMKLKFIEKYGDNFGYFAKEELLNKLLKYGINGNIL